MAQNRAHVHGDAKRNGIESIMSASAVADREIDPFHGQEIHPSTESIVRREARTTGGPEALQKRRAVTTGRARTVPSNPAVYRLRSPWRDIEGRRRYAKPVKNVICGSGLEVGEISVGSKRPPIDERIGYGVREPRLEERSPVAEIAINSIRPVVGNVPGGDSVGRAAGGRPPCKLRLEIQHGIGKRQPSLSVDIAQLRKGARRRSSRTRSDIGANEINGNAPVNQKVAAEQVAYRRIQQHHLALGVRASVKLLDPREVVLRARCRSHGRGGIAA